MRRDLSFEAAFFRTAVASGIVPPRAAIEWADRPIADLAEAPSALLEVSLAAPSAGAIVDALTPLAIPGDAGVEVLRALLDALRRQIADGVVPIAHAFGKAYAATRQLAPDEPLYFDALMLDENYSLARGRIFGSVEAAEAELMEWLEQFRGASERFLPATR